MKRRVPAPGLAIVHALYLDRSLFSYAFSIPPLN
jgi:hypothetical protein